MWPGAMWTVVPPCQPAELLVHALVALFLPLNLSMWKTTSLITWMEKTSLTNVKVIFRYSREWSHFSEKKFKYTIKLLKKNFSQKLFSSLFISRAGQALNNTSVTMWLCFRSKNCWLLHYAICIMSIFVVATLSLHWGLNICLLFFLVTEALIHCCRCRCR